MLCSPVGNSGGPCDRKQNADKQCPPDQKSKCSVSKVRGPLQGSLCSFDEKPEENSCKNDSSTESKTCDREDTGCSSRTSSNGGCGARMSEESRPTKEPTTVADDLTNGRDPRPGFDSEQHSSALMSRRNGEQWSVHESLQVTTSAFRPSKSPATDRTSVPTPTSNNRTKTNQTTTNRTVTNRSDGTLQFEKELYKVEQRRAHLMRRIERKQKELMTENRKTRTSLQDYCEQRNSGGEKQSLHDNRERRPSQHDTSERRLSRYDTSERRNNNCGQSQHNTSERRPSQYDTRRRRPSQHDTRERRSSQHDSRVRRPSQHDTRKRRPSRHDTRERRSSQYDSRERRSSQHDSRERQSSRHDSRERRSSQHDSRERRSSHHGTRARRPSHDNTREQLPSQHDNRELRTSQYDLRERQSSKDESQNRKLPQGSFVVECFCNFSAVDNSCNNEPATKQMSSQHNNTYDDDTTDVRKGAASTGRHSRSGRRSRPRNNASVTPSGSAEQHRSHQDTPRPARGCPFARVVDLIPSIINSSATSVGGTREPNNRGCNETQQYA
ncbi:micronuclear linker histone polyprotein-like [Myzus persicae]|uniref:micronuclear linker histone polyprotein-like n=1 Tax=Myzus persicae TaxID=13164 RepID=UPI000B939EDA|nr:micronuclear linker histone polyprotein-like [Myzus persicae]